MQTLVHLFKLFTGPSMLGMASIIRSGGLLFGLVGYLLVGYLNTSCNILVVKCAHMITHRTGRTNMHFEHLMEECVLLHTEYRHCRRMASWIRKTTLCFIVMCQIGFLCFYIKIIGTMLQSELVRLITNYPLSMAMTQLVVCVALIPYMWLRSLKLLAWASLLGNIFTLVCAVTILQVSVRSLQPVSHVPLINTDMWMLPVLVGSSVFSVEGITMTIPVHNKTKNPRDFGGACGLLMVATTCTLCLNSAIGFFAYLSVGDEVTGNLLVTLPNEWGYTAVKFAYALVVFLTFALQGYLPGEILAAKIKESSKIDVVTRQADKIARTAVVVVTYLVAALIPNVELAMSLCGSFTVVFIVFIFPPVAEMLILSKDEGGVPKLVLVKDCAILVFGVLAFFTGTYTSIRDIILAF
ncbi:proton-coupled amino acid transporter 1 [Aplysia californica]|uniref:Proton-coupled amino acid transporter 1 n=1 Tax=Aplysia californica TaxID=6500 RepID=A0ABM0JX00_APLCA|nr:proton-coupled amino acid transporter 1 [Aplysia californica]